MSLVIRCPKCDGVMIQWKLIGSGEDQVWEKTKDYHCLDCEVVIESIRPAVEIVDHNTDGFIM